MYLKQGEDVIATWWVWMEGIIPIGYGILQVNDEKGVEDVEPDLAKTLDEVGYVMDVILQDVNEVEDIPYVDGVMGNKGDGFIKDGVIEENEGDGKGDGAGEGDGEDDGANMEVKDVDDGGHVQLRRTRNP
ncbi:unnamed protein product [Lactuca virosa]|uniref:Uncharacterized protein n=1 Tax=Lactuca virosa TaxID=75947 RepID=A0AAU9N1I6_9ASTR|nr:unnamed protein product [Lactuca virosa]